jgi:hypothetical protein
VGSLVPVGENCLGFLDFIFGTGEVKSQFTRSACDMNNDRGQTTVPHSKLELFVSLMDTMALKTIHDQGSACRSQRAITKACPD